MAQNEEFKKNLRSSIEKRFEQQKEERRREMFRRRIEIASHGVIEYENREFAEAVQAFRNYISILEEWKKCPPGGLMPTHFDRKIDIPEMLLISGIFWDLAKIYDRSKYEREFRMYLEKYVQFTKGMPYESLCIETLRKFINLSKPVHKEEFKKAFVKMGGKHCFVATALQPELSQMDLDDLRRFRDQRLIDHPIGLEFCFQYYQHGRKAVPWVVAAPRWMRRTLSAVIRASLALGGKLF